LIPGLILFSHAIHLLWKELTSETVGDGLVVFFFLVAACITLFSSSLFHLHYCAGEKAYRFWGCIDFSGYSLMIDY
jgi:predicted membrane channel-forming protein YqfA (hemolysin III family)